MSTLTWRSSVTVIWAWPGPAPSPHHPYLKEGLPAKSFPCGKWTMTGGNRLGCCLEGASKVGTMGVSNCRGWWSKQQVEEARRDRGRCLNAACLSGYHPADRLLGTAEGPICDFHSWISTKRADIEWMRTRYPVCLFSCPPVCLLPRSHRQEALTSRPSACCSSALLWQRTEAKS